MKLTSFILAGAMSVLAVEGQAATVHYQLTGGGINATFALTYGSAVDGKYDGEAKDCAEKPTFCNGNSTAVANRITGAKGSMTYSGIEGNLSAKIDGLAAVKQDTPEDTNLLAPLDFSRFPVATNTEHGFASYDNLLWLSGSPQTASDFPFSGGALDIYGVLLSLGNGLFLNVWSDGNFPPNGVTKPTYGFSIVSAETAMTYHFDGADLAEVPLPAAGFALVAGIGALAAAARKKKAG